MDYNKIGKFISIERKKKNLTQAMLAKKIFVSEKTISKWENGKGLPDTSLLIDLCNVLEVSVNELLSGERFSSDLYRERAEDNLVMLSSNFKTNRNKIILSALICIACISVLLVCTLLAGFLEIKIWLRILLIVYGTLMAIFGLIVAVILDRNAGYYECKYCKTKFVPSYKSYIAGAHTLTKRYLKCPQCGKKSYCKKRLSK